MNREMLRRQGDRLVDLIARVREIHTQLLSITEELAGLTQIILLMVEMDGTPDQGDAPKAEGHEETR